MGGALTIRILEEGSGVLESIPELILQPQSEVFRVRLWLYDHGFTIDDEDMVLEDGKYYPILHCIHAAAGEKQNLTGAEAYYGPVLLRKKHPILRQFLLYEQEVQEKILAQLANASARTASARKEEVRAVLRRNREVLDGMRE
jgi:tRNA (adenine22-N1)-methyltransferase